MKKLTDSIALDLNKKLILTYILGEMIGIKDSGLLDSTLNRPFQTMFGESLYKDI